MDHEELEELLGEAEPEMEDEVTPAMQRQLERNCNLIRGFLGDGERESGVVVLPRYYNELLTWAVHHYLEAQGWRIVRVLGYRYSSEPIYVDVYTNYGQCRNLPSEGCLLVEKGAARFTIAIYPKYDVAAIKVEGPASKKEEIGQFVQGVTSIAREENFYRGKKLMFSGRIYFLDLPDRPWESIILSPGLKADIQANTLGFLANQERLARYGIPLKRGVLLVGEPGTGKTLICKALMSQTDKSLTSQTKRITGILACADLLLVPGYISELYQLAQDLSPSIVFIEDIDMVAEVSRRHPPLLSLLSELDGVEEHQKIITVATTNHLEILDKAISQRPSRFDRVIQLPRPALEERRRFVSLLSSTIPMDESTQSYLADKTEGFTPAQIQETAYTLVIEYTRGNPDNPDCFSFSAEEVNSAIARINGRNGHRLGFGICGNHNHDVARRGYD